MSLFDAVLDDLIAKEGTTYTDIPGDLGGPTKFGITLKTLSIHRGHDCTPDDVKNLQEDEARLIYTELYLSPFSQFSVFEWLFRLLVDSAVQHGVDRVKQWLDEIVANTTDPETIRRKLFIRRLQFYGAIITDRPVNAKFAKGWMIRLSYFVR